MSELGLKRVCKFKFAVCATLVCLSSPAAAETMAGALARAYESNPDINQQRAAVRVRDEDAPKAETGLRPKAGLTFTESAQYTGVRNPAGRDRYNNRVYSNDHYFSQPSGGTLSVSQTLFDGGRTPNSVRQAESGIFAARATMRVTEQTVLEKGATAYMDVLRDTAVLRLRKNNISVLQEQLRQTRVRYNVGDVTFTDLAQAQAAVAQARADYYGAEANLRVSCANYEQVIGVEPKRLEPASSMEKLLPRTPSEGIVVAQVEHPSVVAALHQSDAAALGVKVAEGALAPTLSINVQATRQNDPFTAYPKSRMTDGQAIAQLSVPIYQGGGEYASIRQAKEQFGQTQLAADLQRTMVRAAVLSAYARLNAAKEARRSGGEVVKAAEEALRGVRLEASVGQRTVLDVLNAQQALLDARVKVVGYQHDEVVASYSALSAIGRLGVSELNLGAEPYDPSDHFDKVKDRWIGTSTPEGD